MDEEARQPETKREDGGLSPFRIPFEPPPGLRKPSALQRRQSSPSAAPSPGLPSLTQTVKPTRKGFTGTGYSGFDWASLPLEPPSALRRITTEELALHSTEGDFWIAIQGRVYNVSQYVPFHPGGKYQILRGKGKDATELFMKAHPWINPESLLKRVWLGFLIRSSPAPPSNSSKT
jgi:predicted heme/steroid binding protein